jgi:hypothetical protein
MMEEIIGEGGKKWGVENYSIKRMRKVVYIEWRMEEMVILGEINIQRGNLAWRISTNG